MSLDMYGMIDPVMESVPDGGVELVRAGDGDYSGPGGVWVEASPTVTTITLVTIQQADMREVRLLQENGGVTNPTDVRAVYINDGTMIYPDDNGKFADMLRFSDGTATRDWRVVKVDNRPWRNYCKAIVERYRGER